MYRRYQAGLAPDNIAVESVESPEKVTGRELAATEAG
jgi:hypothetical protein